MFLVKHLDSHYLPHLMTWNLNPIAFSILGLDVRWYGIAYITGFFLALFIGKIIYEHLVSEDVEKDVFEDLVFLSLIHI